MLVGFDKVIKELENSKEEYVTGRISAGLTKDCEDTFKRVLRENGYHDFEIYWEKNPIDKTDSRTIVCNPYVEYRISTKQTEPQQKEDEESGARALLFFAMLLLVIGGIFIW